MTSEQDLPLPPFPLPPAIEEELANTPRKICSTDHTELGLKHFEELRKDLMVTLPEAFPEVELGWFFENLLPSVMPGTVPAIVALLQRQFKGGPPGKRDKTYPAAIINGRWSWYPKDPANMTGTEDKVFAGFHKIYAVIVAAAETVLQDVATAETRIQATTIDRSESKNSNYKHDANQRLTNSLGAGKIKPGDNYACDSITNWEFKKSDVNDAVNKNREQLLGNAAGLMFTDPARRFRLGITIENTSTRLWFLSRAQCVVSKPFNFITEYQHLVHFFASTSFASNEDLGYDPTVRRVPVERLIPQPDSSGEGKEKQAYSKEVAYEYMVKDGDQEIWYQTVDKAVFSYRAARLLGRAIRVWKVRRVEFDEHGKGTLVGPVMALKDYWITKSSKTEGEIQHDIFKRAKATRERRGEPPESVEEDIRKHFMTIVHDVPVLLNGEADSSERFIRQPVPRDCDREPVQLPSQRQATEAHITSDNHTAEGAVTGSTGPASDHPRLPEEEGAEAVKFIFEARRHRRLVFAEVGVPLHELKDHRLLFQSLAEATKGLKVLHDAEYVHRDISTGNLLLCNIASGPICKISDLEYARPQVMPLIAGEAEHDHKTGTPFFMSIEVQIQAFANRMSVWGQRLPPFLHSYLHDLEGLWWIAMWSLFHAIPTARIHEVERNLEQRLNQEMTAGRIFPVSLQGSLERNGFLLREAELDLKVRHIPAEFRGALPSMKQIAQLLVARYYAIQSDAIIQQINTPEPYAPIYEPMEQCFRNAMQHAASDVRLIADVRAKAKQRKAKEKKQAALASSGQNGKGRSSGKRTAEDAADQPTSGPSKRAKKDNAPPVSVEDHDMADEPPSPTVAVQKRAESKKSGGRRSKETVSLSTRFSERIKAALNRTKSK